MEPFIGMIVDLNIIASAFNRVIDFHGRVVGLYITPVVARIAWQREDGPYSERPFVVHYIDQFGNLYGGAYDLTHENVFSVLKLEDL